MQATARPKVIKLSYGVYIIGSGADGRINGMTAAWVTQLSIAPPLIGVAINKSHYTCELIEKSRSFSVNVLSEKDFDLAVKCGFGSGRNTTRLGAEQVCFKKTGSPVLIGSAAYMDCALKEVVSCGDHRLYIGEVVESGESGLQCMRFDDERFFGGK